MCFLAPWSDPSIAGEDPWWEIRPLITAINENRRRQVIQCPLRIADEMMSAYRPRTTPSGDLEHVSFVVRKPKNLGTEFKSIHDGRHGVLLLWRSKKGKMPWRKRNFATRSIPRLRLRFALRLV